MLAGLVVFVLVYALLAVPRLGRRLREGASERAPARVRPLVEAALGRPGIVTLGALLVVLLGALAPRAALLAIDWRTLALLTGMMLLVAALEAANVFAVLATHLARRLPTPRLLLVGSMAVVAVLSALVLNDAVVLLFTPVLIHAARSLRVSAIPFLVGEALAANLGSAATPVGNPQNALIALRWDIPFLDFAAALAPVALLGLALGIAFCLLAFRRDLAGAGRAGSIEVARISNVPMLAIAAAALGLALGGFVFGPALGVPLWMSALGAGVLALALAPAARVSPLRVGRQVDAGILLFFVGLFVLLEAVREAGVLGPVAAALDAGGSGVFVAVTAVLSNLVSNVPAVLLLMPGVDSQAEALLLAVSSTFAGNATFLGSAATVIVAETARQHGEDFSVLRFTLVGFPLAAVTLVLAWLILGA